MLFISAASFLKPLFHQSWVLNKYSICSSPKPFICFSLAKILFSPTSLLFLLSLVNIHVRQLYSNVGHCIVLHIEISYLLLLVMLYDFLLVRIFSRDCFFVTFCIMSSLLSYFSFMFCRLLSWLL